MNMWIHAKKCLGSDKHDNVLWLENVLFLFGEWIQVRVRVVEWGCSLAVPTNNYVQRGVLVIYYILPHNYKIFRRSVSREWIGLPLWKALFYLHTIMWLWKLEVFLSKFQMECRSRSKTDIRIQNVQKGYKLGYVQLEFSWAHLRLATWGGI